MYSLHVSALISDACLKLAWLIQELSDFSPNCRVWTVTHNKHIHEHRPQLQVPVGH